MTLGCVIWAFNRCIRWTRFLMAAGKVTYCQVITMTCHHVCDAAAEEFLVGVIKFKEVWEQFIIREIQTLKVLQWGELKVRWTGEIRKKTSSWDKYLMSLKTMTVCEKWSSAVFFCYLNTVPESERVTVQIRLWETKAHSDTMLSHYTVGWLFITVYSEYILRNSKTCICCILSL